MKLEKIEKSVEFEKDKNYMQQWEEQRTDFADIDFKFVLGQIMSKFLSILLDYPTEEKVKKAKSLAEFLCSCREIFPEYIVELADEVSNLNFSEELQADYVSIFDLENPPFISFWAKSENQNLFLILDSIYISEGVYVEERKFPDEFSTIFEFLSVLYSRKKGEKIKNMRKILRPVLYFPEISHPLYGKVVEAMENFLREFLFEK